MAVQLPPQNAQEVERLHGLLKSLQTARQQYAAPAGSAGTADAATQSGLTVVDINAEIARERKIRNDDAEQDIRLKRATINWLFIFLASETVVIFAFALFQATRWLGFNLEEWTFQLLSTATLAQITGMLFVAVRYLFPNRGEK